MSPDLRTTRESYFYLWIRTSPHEEEHAAAQKLLMVMREAFDKVSLVGPLLLSSIQERTDVVAFLISTDGKSCSFQLSRPDGPDYLRHLARLHRRPSFPFRQPDQFFPLPLPPVNFT